MYTTGFLREIRAKLFCCSGAINNWQKIVLVKSLSQERQKAKYAYNVTHGADRVETGETFRSYVKFEFQITIVESVVV